MKFATTLLFLAVLLTGLNAGIGFANAIGYMPAFADTAPSHALSFWQHADHYFRARMPVFGNAMLLVLLTTVILFRKQWRTIPYALLVLALLMDISEIVVIFTQNLPINTVMQQLDPDHINVLQLDQLRNKAIDAFHIRSFLSIAVFVLTAAVAPALQRKTR